jgi:hypothetical protein
MDDLISNADIRNARSAHRAQGPCRICGETYSGCIEQHHIAGRAYHGQTEPVCRNCHRKLSDRQLDHPDRLGSDVSFLEMVGHMLLGVADMFRALADTFVEFGHRLIAMASASDVEAIS